MKKPRPEFLAREEGATAVEFGLIAPVLLVMILGIVDYGLAMFHKIELSSAVRSGAQYAMIQGFNAATIQNIVQNSTNLPQADLTVPNPTQSCTCSDGSTVACDGTCPAGDPWVYVTVTASYSFTPLFLPMPVQLSESASLRIR